VNKYARPAPVPGTSATTSSWQASSQAALNANSDAVSPGCPPSPRPVAVGVQAFTPALSAAAMPSVDTAPMADTMPSVDHMPSASGEVKQPHLDASVGLS